MVFAHHALGSLKGTFVHGVVEVCSTGVQIFFLLSAFLITELLLREREQTGSIHMRSFYVRRILRIWPLYFAFLGFTWILATLFHRGEFPWLALLAFTLLSGNWYVHFFGWLLSIAGPLWSISVEEQFYLVWPFVIRVGSRRAAYWVSTFFLLLTVVVALIAGRHVPVRRFSYWTNSFLEFEFFAVGALLALVFHRRNIALPSAIRLFYLVSGMALLGVAFIGFHLDQEAVSRSWDLLGGFLLMGVAVALFFRGFLGMRLPHAAAPLVTLGKVSYGLYVFHYGCLQICAKLLPHAGVKTNTPMGIVIVAWTALSLTLLMAFVSYRLLEQPFLLIKRRFTVVKSRVD
jgi:peptidoglycan/LPS O-acetylase OafA/YrhL